MDYTNLLKTLWADIYNLETNVRSVVEKYFHPSYQQCINGVRMDRERYIEHVTEQRQSMTVENIDYKCVIENGCELFALYYPVGKNAKGEPLSAEVIAYYQFIEERVSKIIGSVRLLEGDYSDVDMRCLGV